MKLRSVSALATSVVLTGCDTFGAGPCSHTYRDPLLTVASVTNRQTGTSIGQVVLSDFRINGQSLPTDIVASAEPRMQIALPGNGTIVCHVACAFGTMEGQYEFVATAAGYEPATVRVDARFPTFEGGCPSYNAGTNRLELTLSPAS